MEKCASGGKTCKTHRHRLDLINVQHDLQYIRSCFSFIFISLYTHMLYVFIISVKISHYEAPLTTIPINICITMLQFTAGLCLLTSAHLQLSDKSSSGAID